MGTRRNAREFAVKLLYQKEMNDSAHDFVFEEFWKIEEASKDEKEFTESLFLGVVEHINEIDEIIKKQAHNWDITRISAIDRNVLRLAIYEMFYLKEIPLIVSINEAIDIAKKYSTGDSGKFVNGILDKLKETLTDRK